MSSRSSATDVPLHGVPRTLIERVPLHRRVAEILRGEIASGLRPGDRLESESALAARLGVSLPTVREALSTLAHEGLVSRRHGSGTYVIGTRRDGRIAILIDLDISHPRTSRFYLRVTQRLRRFFEERGSPARLYVGHAEPGGREPEGLTCREFLEDLALDRLNGVAAVAVNAHRSWMEPLRARRVPVVGNTRGYQFRVFQDYEGLVRAGVDELVRCGRRRLALLGSVCPEVFESSLRTRGLPVRREWMRVAVHGSRPGSAAAGLVAAWNASRERPDGLLVTDDLLFMDAVNAIVSLGVRVPEDLCVVTHSNRGCMPPLPFPATLLEFDPDEFADAMGAMLETLLAGRRPPRREVVLGFERLRAEGPCALRSVAR